MMIRPRKPDLAPSATEADCLSELRPGHAVARPTAWRAGVVFASPHSGRVYPRAFRAVSILSAAQLRRNEDMFVDRLINSAVDAGAPLIAAHFPRCYVDVNRAPDELPPSLSLGTGRNTPRAQAGIGVVPTHIGERAPIYRRPPSQMDVQARIDRLYTPYHADLRGLLDEAHDLFGQALLIDCHSMPGFAPMGSRRPDIVLGDRFGRACHAQTLSDLREILQSIGFSVAVNYPYAGGYVTEHYGQPDTGVEAIQIEINRDLYLNPVTLAKKRSYDDLAARLTTAIGQLMDQRAPSALAAQ